MYPFRSRPRYLETVSGAWLSGRDPNLPLAELVKRWVPGTRILYIGKASSPGKSGTLHERIKLLSQFGWGRLVEHWGGRLIWQLERSEDLVVCWRPTPDEVPRRVEARLLQRFEARYGRLPFANLRG